MGTFNFQLSTFNLNAMRKTQESTMMHVCEIEPYIIGGDGTISYGEPIQTVCGFKSLSRERNAGAMYDAVEADAEMRLPLSIEVGSHDRVTLIKSFDRELDPVLHFEVTDIPDSFGPSGHVIRLKEVYI